MGEALLKISAVFCQGIVMFALAMLGNCCGDKKMTR